MESPSRDAVVPPAEPTVPTAPSHGDGALPRSLTPSLVGAGVAALVSSAFAFVTMQTLPAEERVLYPLLNVQSILFWCFATNVLAGLLHHVLLLRGADARRFTLLGLALGVLLLIPLYAAPPAPTSFVMPLHMLATLIGVVLIPRVAKGTA